MNYVETVADLLHKRSSLQILSAADYVLIAELEKEEIPLDIVLSSIIEDLSNIEKTGNSAKIKSVGHFQENIRRNFADWLQKSVSK